jgi:N-acetylneuraminate synthase
MWTQKKIMSNIKVIAEIGINHNGSVEIAKKLIDAAALAGCDYVKFQKRTPEICVPEKQKGKIRSTPWGEMTYLDYKHRLEFGKEEYDQIDAYCKEKNIGWFASVWDAPSSDFMSDYTDITKVPSALITDIDLCKKARQDSETLLISTGMSEEREIVECIDACDPDVVMHTNSSYPSPVGELNLNYIKSLQKNYPGKEIGYSGHEYGLVTTFASVALGATWIERHITLDRTLWGSDHLASVEPQGLIKLVKGIRDIELALGDGGPRVCAGVELDKRSSLRS